MLSVEALAQQLHELKHTGAEEMLGRLRQLVEEQGVVGELPKVLAYLEKREGQMQYVRFREEGWPIGSGSGESANKLVVEARLKGAGMHWAVQNVNPMLALRNAVCNDRWVEVWGQIEAEQRRQVQVRREERRRQRRPQPVPGAACRAKGGAVAQGVAPVPAPQPTVRECAPDGRPAADHPWRRAWSRRRQGEAARTV